MANIEMDVEGDSLESIKTEVIQLPADVSIWYSTQRPEMLKMIKRPMGEDEVAGVMDVLAGEMRMNWARQRIIQTQEECIDLMVAELDRIDSARKDAMQEIKDTRATIKQITGGTE